LEIRNKLAEITPNKNEVNRMKSRVAKDEITPYKRQKLSHLPNYACKEEVRINLSEKLMAKAIPNTKRRVTMVKEEDVHEISDDTVTEKSSMECHEDINDSIEEMKTEILRR
jgi:hypothetical protein